MYCDGHNGKPDELHELLLQQAPARHSCLSLELLVARAASRAGPDSLIAEPTTRGRRQQRCHSDNGGIARVVLALARARSTRASGPASESAGKFTEFFLYAVTHPVLDFFLASRGLWPAPTRSKRHQKHGIPIASSIAISANGRADFTFGDNPGRGRPLGPLIVVVHQLCSSWCLQCQLSV